MTRALRYIIQLYIKQNDSCEKGRFVNVCTNKSGSFVAETIWSVANLKQRMTIAEELKPSEIQLKNDMYARFLVSKIGLGCYKRKPEEWKNIQSNEFKKRKMLAELFSTTDTSAETTVQTVDNSNPSHKKKFNK